MKDKGDNAKRKQKYKGDNREKKDENNNKNT